MGKKFIPVCVPQIVNGYLGNTRSYYVPITRDNEINITTIAGQVDVRGNVIDRLAAYEKICIEPDELYDLLKARGMLPKAALSEEARREYLSHRWE